MSISSFMRGSIRTGYFAWLLGCLSLTLMPLALRCPAEEVATPDKGDRSTREEVELLIEQLDADEFEIREAATKSLIELEEVALTAVAKRLDDETSSSEAKRRCSLIVASIRKRIVLRNPIKIADFFDDVAKAHANKNDWQVTQARLSHLVNILRSETKSEKLKLPFDIAKLANQIGGARVNRTGLCIDTIVSDSSMREGLAMATTAITLSSASNSILITPGVCELSHADNCIIIAGRGCQCGIIRNSIVICGDYLNCSITDDCIFAARLPVHVSIARRSIFVNCQASRTDPARENSHVTIDALIMPPEPPAPVLQGLFTITTLAARDFVLFKLPDGTGEYVIRKGNEFQRPDGSTIEALRGWRLTHVSSTGAAFEKEGAVCFVQKITPDKARLR